MLVARKGVVGFGVVAGIGRHLRQPHDPQCFGHQRAHFVNKIVRTDYAGSLEFNQDTQTGQHPDAVPVPASFKWPDNTGKTTATKADDLQGMIFKLSEIKGRQVVDGTSKTYLIGEKYVDTVLNDLCPARRIRADST